MKPAVKTALEHELEHFKVKRTGYRQRRSQLENELSVLNECIGEFDTKIAELEEALNDRPRA